MGVWWAAGGGCSLGGVGAESIADGGIALAGKPKQTKDLVHAAPSNVAAILGVAYSNMWTWRKIPSFPKLNGDKQLCVRDVVEWWLANKADKAKQTALHGDLAQRLGLVAAGETGSSGEAVPATSERGMKEQMEMLELRTRLAKFEREFGDLVRVRHVAPVLQAMGKSIRDILESMHRATGYPIGDGVERAIESAIEELSQLAGSANDNAG